MRNRIFPLATIVLVLILAWYGLALILNHDQAVRLAGDAQPSWWDLVKMSWSLDRPLLPVPHQIAAELWRSVFTIAPWAKRSLLFHAGVTAGSTLVGFCLGILLGIVLAAGIVHVRTLDRALMPWIITSQTVPILAIAPMIVVVLGNLGLTGLLPKAVISMYLGFFPVAIGMVKGLRSPDPLQLDLMRSYSAGRWTVFWKLRLRASIPFLFASLKVAIAISLVGAIVGELPTGASAGLGARLLSGSYYGQTVQIWAALFMAAFLGLFLLLLIAAIERLYFSRAGGRA
ncbi:MAG TPA: ABC transporter permease [Dongiaceae bacterium]|nr:ABC transporter permease [Dongiaceae bacterium]